MTREQLDAIRARVDAATPGPWLTDSCLDVYTEQVREIDPDIGMELYKTVYSHHTHGPEGTQPWHDTHFMAHAREDVPALLAEVERLRDAHAMAVQVSGELCEKCGWAMKFPGEKCRCDLLAEVERLTADPLPAAAWVREVEQAAFARGVAAMREAAAQKVTSYNIVVVDPAGRAFPVLESPLQALADELCALPGPEDKS